MYGFGIVTLPDDLSDLLNFYQTFRSSEDVVTASATTSTAAATLSSNLPTEINRKAILATAGDTSLATAPPISAVGDESVLTGFSIPFGETKISSLRYMNAGR